MAFHSCGGCYSTTRRLQQYGRPYQPKHSPSYSELLFFIIIVTHLNCSTILYYVMKL